MTPWELADVALHQLDDDMVELRIRVPAVDGLRAHSILQRHGAAARREAIARAPEGASAEAAEPVLVAGAYQARAFVEACDAASDARPSDQSGLDRHTLVLHADADDLVSTPVRAGGSRRRVRVRAGSAGRQTAMDPRVLRRLACTARYAVIGHGNDAGVSGTTSVVPARLRRALEARDQACRFPGCGRASRLDAHHIVHWADGGPTRLDNLVLLCGFHHHFVHRTAWDILHDGHGHFRFQPPGELPMATTLPLPGASTEAPAHRADGDADILRPTAWEPRPTTTRRWHCSSRPSSASSHPNPPRWPRSHAPSADPACRLTMRRALR